jgi:hypothetical protein
MVERMVVPQAQPKPLLLDYLFAFGIGLWCLGAAVGFIVACSYEALLWWAIRTATGTPLALLSAALVARSLQRREG